MKKKYQFLNLSVQLVYDLKKSWRKAFHEFLKFSKHKHQLFFPPNSNTSTFSTFVRRNRYWKWVLQEVFQKGVTFLSLCSNQIFVKHFNFLYMKRGGICKQKIRLYCAVKQICSEYLPLHLGTTIMQNSLPRPVLHSDSTQHLNDSEDSINLWECS